MQSPERAKFIATSYVNQWLAEYFALCMFTFNAFYELNRMIWFVVFAFLISLLTRIFTPANDGVRPARRAFELKGINKKFARFEVDVVKRARPACQFKYSSDFVLAWQNNQAKLVFKSIPNLTRQSFGRLWMTFCRGGRSPLRTAFADPDLKIGPPPFASQRVEYPESRIPAFRITRSRGRGHKVGEPTRHILTTWRAL